MDGSAFSWRAIAVSALLGGAVGYVMFARSQTPGAEPRVVTTRPALGAEETQTVALFRNASPSVVYINTTAYKHVDLGGHATGPATTGQGSGFVWDDAGHIVTNFHVIGNSDTAEVHDDKGNVYPGEVIGVAPENDLAVLKITPSGAVRPIPVGTSADLQVGQKVFAIGNPFGFDRSLTTGIISALGRAVPFPETDQPIENVIQTDAAINPGNSGGPLLDSAGRLIGVNSALWSPTGLNVGIGFAVPVDTVNRIVPSLIRDGRGRPTLGVVCHDGLSEWFRRTTGVGGAVIVRTLDGSAARAAGLKPTTPQFNQTVIGDVLLKIGDQPVASAAEVDAALSHYKPGDTVAVTFFRGGQEQTKRIMLDSSMKRRD